MRILHLSWEYPPLIYGGIAPHVASLAAAQAAAGHDVTVLTQSHPQAPPDSDVDGVRVVRVDQHPPAMGFAASTLLAWVATLNSAMSASLPRLAQVDVVHAHDWVTAWVASVAHEGFGLPLVATFHSTEKGRHQGHLPSELSESVHQIEAWLAGMASQLITCSASMRDEVAAQFPGRPWVIPNGVDPAAWSVTRSPDPAPLLLFAGRLEWEKGVFDLIDAMPTLRRRVPGVRLVMAGAGVQEAALAERIRARRLGRAVELAGHVSHDELGRLYARAHAVVVPSRYEPFGMVALEAAAVGAPLVLARTGGLAEVARGGAAAVLFEPGDVPGLVAAVIDALSDPAAALARTSAARADIEGRYAWPIIAEQTSAVYAAALEPRSAASAPG